LPDPAGAVSITYRYNCILPAHTVQALSYPQFVENSRDRAPAGRRACESTGGR